MSCILGFVTDYENWNDWRSDVSLGALLQRVRPQNGPRSHLDPGAPVSATLTREEHGEWRNSSI